MIYCDKCIKSLDHDIYVAIPYQNSNGHRYFHIDCLSSEAIQNIFGVAKTENDIQKNICKECQDTGIVSEYNGVDRDYEPCSKCKNGYMELSKNMLNQLKINIESDINKVNLLLKEVRKDRK